MIFNVFRKSGGETRALTSEQLSRMISGSATSASGVRVTPETAAKFGAVFACVRVRAESVGQLPLHFYERRGRAKQKAEDHPLYALLHDAPNEATTAQEFWEWVSASLDLRGNAYVYINRLPSGEIFELLPLQATWVEVKRDKKRDIFYEVRLPRASSDAPGDEVQRYSADQVLHFKLMSLDGLLGASVIEYARETIGMGVALERHGGLFFRNGGTPGGVLKTDQMLAEESYKRIKEDWDSRYGGLENAHRVAILEAGLTWQSVGIPLKDAQFLEGRKFQRSEIAGLFRVPPHLIGDLERATFSNIEQQGLDFVIHGLMPALTRIEQRVKLQLVPKVDRRKFFAKFNVGGLVRGDMAARAAYYTAQLQNGALSPNEIRELEDLNPRDGGDVYLTPMNMLIDGEPSTQPEPQEEVPSEDQAPDETV